MAEKPKVNERAKKSEPQIDKNEPVVKLRQKKGEFLKLY